MSLAVFHLNNHLVSLLASRRVSRVESLLTNQLEYLLDNLQFYLLLSQQVAHLVSPLGSPVRNLPENQVVFRLMNQLPNPQRRRRGSHQVNHQANLQEILPINRRDNHLKNRPHYLLDSRLSSHLDSHPASLQCLQLDNHQHFRRPFLLGSLLKNLQVILLECQVVVQQDSLPAYHQVSRLEALLVGPLAALQIFLP